MHTTLWDIGARVIMDLAHTGIVFYVVYSLRLYLMARLERFGPETLTRAETATADTDTSIYGRMD